MTAFDFVVCSPVGIHACPALELSSYAQTLPCRVSAEYDGRRADVKKVMPLMRLGVHCGQKVTFILEGAGEEEAAAKLKHYCEKNL